MIETIIPSQFEHEPDEDDVRAIRVMRDLQDIVDRMIRQRGCAIGELSPEEQQGLVEELQRHIDFEIEQSGELIEGMPVAVSGEGAFLAAFMGQVVGADAIGDKDILTGMIGGVQALPVPSRESILTALRNGKDVPVGDMTLSVVLEIKDGRLHKGGRSGVPSDDAYDLSHLSIVIPFRYGMPLRILDIDPALSR